MGKITAAEVNKLRKHTGAGMMDCKKALVESDGDFEKAVDFLRKKGQKVAAKRADKEASEGVVMAKTNDDNTFGAVVMVNCETDFVAKNEDFIAFVNSIVDSALKEAPKSADEFKNISVDGRTVEEGISDQIGKIGEKIELGDYQYIESDSVFAYNHQGNKLATLLGLNKSGDKNVDAIGHELAMQVAAMNPIAVDKEDVDPQTIEREIEIGKEQAKQEGKPENLLEKIAMGKLNKFYKENTLLNQDFVRDTKKTVKQYIKEHDESLRVTGFRRVMVGE